MGTYNFNEFKGYTFKWILKNGSQPLHYFFLLQQMQTEITTNLTKQSAQ